MWRTLPPWFKAVALGLLVSGVPTIVWAVAASINLKFTPRVPWSVPLMAVILWLLWRYAGGDGPQHRLSAFRREHLRATPLSTGTWRVALAAGGSGLAAVWAAFDAFRGILHLTPQTADLARFPAVTIVAALLMGSAVAGVAEEAGFRGYMQLPLERAYGPWIAIATTSIIFTLVHLTHGAGVLPMLPFYFAAAVIYGLLTMLTGSIFPSMTLHFTGDALMFTMQYLLIRFGAAGPSSGRVEPLPAIVALLFAAISIGAFRLLTRHGPLGAPAEPLAAGSH